MRQALTGYTYQHDVAFFFLAKMDVEQQITKIRIEAKVDHQFDDVHLQTKGGNYYIQIKDFESIRIDELVEKDNKIRIQNTWHELSPHTNIIFLKQIDINPNCKILGLDAFQYNQTYIISMNREALGDYIENLYHINDNRERIILKFFKKQLDKRVWDIDITDLPSIPLFNKKLMEKSINVGRKKLASEGLLYVEGKPGVGKSHYVNELTREYRQALTYRFWTSNQDKDREKRLKYGWFLFDLSKEIYGNQKKYTETQIVKKLKGSKRTIIIDGLDHVENYNPKDLDKYISFIDKIRKHNQVIVLSRPLIKQTKWNKHVLGNWNKSQTKKVLKELYFIDDHRLTESIYKITKGYPILLRYIAEYYKKYKNLPEIKNLNTIEEYYGQLIDGNRGLRPFALFLCSNAYHMQSEITFLMGDELGQIILEFIDNHPYLFEIRLNRIALFHDSFNTYLRKNIGDYTETEERVKNLVISSILSGKQRYQSRINSFNFDDKTKIKIFKQYSNINYFEEILSKTLDIEALRSFYEQLQESLIDLDLRDIDIITVYDLSLILNILNRDHTSTLDQFLYTYLKYLIFLGYTEEDITSDDSLFAMLYYIRTGDNSLLYNIHSDSNYNVSRFQLELENSIEDEDEFFNHFRKKWPTYQIKNLVEHKYDEHSYERWKALMTNLYLYNHHKVFDNIKAIITQYIDDNEDAAIHRLEDYFEERSFRRHPAARILRDAKNLVLALGHKHKGNDYLHLDFKAFITKHKARGSFDLWIEVLNYLRLALHQKRKIDIHQIHQFWSKYHNRHDYSLNNIAVVLSIFEDLNFIKQNQSIRLITKVQRQSEKGYRNLLIEYIEAKPVGILKYLNEYFTLDELHINWFSLSPKYINQLPDRIFNYQLGETLYYHRSNKEVDIQDVLNVLHSNRLEDLKRKLKMYGFIIRIKENDKKEIAYLNKYNIKHILYKKDYEYKRETSKQRFVKGVLLNEDFNFVKRTISSPAELAKYRDNNYSVLSEIELYKVFDKELIKKELKQVFINALIAKDKDAKYFGRLYYFPSNVVKMVKDYDPDVDLTQFFKSFKKYVELSSFEL